MGIGQKSKKKKSKKKEEEKRRRKKEIANRGEIIGSCEQPSDRITPSSFLFIQHKILQQCVAMLQCCYNISKLLCCINLSLIPSNVDRMNPRKPNENEKTRNGKQNYYNRDVKQSRAIKGEDLIEPQEERDLSMERRNNEIVRESRDCETRILKAYAQYGTLAVRILIISFYFITLSLLNARAMMFVSIGKQTVIRKAEDERGRRFFGGQKNGWMTILHYRRRDILTSMLFTYCFIHNQ